MKRFVLLLLLAVLPLQMTWAMVTSYCQHEEGKAAQHFGHHEHKHQGAAVKKDNKKQISADNDCGYCHLSHIKYTSTDLVIGGFPPQSIAVPFKAHAYRSFVPDVPSRPDRPAGA
jgi:hypothetical protein